ncbi:MAG: hypothetical protein EB027_03295, partial [Actinobacteria bacterium]|nr:hypothetical protein [Actinomycetota bacterium]
MLSIMGTARGRVSALRRWRALEEVLSALAAESEVGQLPHSAFATATSDVCDTTLPGLTAARRANELLLNPFEWLASGAHPDVRGLCQVMALAFNLSLTTGASLAAAALQGQEH